MYHESFALPDDTCDGNWVVNVEFVRFGWTGKLAAED